MNKKTSSNGAGCGWWGKGDVVKPTVNPGFWEFKRAKPVKIFWFLLSE